MKFIQYNNGVVIDVLNIRDDATIENIAIVESIPVFERRDGYNGVLKYDETGLYWEYEETVISDEIPSDEFYSMLEEVL